MTQYRVLTSDQAEQFREEGFVVLRGAFSRRVAAALTEPAWRQIGYDPGDPSTWTEPVVHTTATRRFEVRKFAPTAWGAICDLVGGEERMSSAPLTFTDAFILNLTLGADQPWVASPADIGGWHKDGDTLRHFLDSPQYGLLTLVLWSDVHHQGGATMLATDSVRPVARFLAANPQGVHPFAHLVPEERETYPDDGVFDYPALVSQCSHFVEATGDAGDIYLLHPFLLHTKSQNILRRPRFLTNPVVRLVEPMRFDRPAAETSLVEASILRALDVPRYEFTPAAPRRTYDPPRPRGLAEEARRFGFANASPM
jgi:hypothetical protein